MESSNKMKAVVLKDKAVLEYTTDLKDVPKPGKGQVLIKVEASVINPSDLYMMQGDYSGTFEYPLVPGSEGAGTVVSSGGGIIAWSLVGKRVGFIRQSDKPGRYSKDGAYAEYIVANAAQCVTYGPNIPWEQAACSFVNPLTAVGLLDRCRQHKAKAVI